jgi:hypothetical protein
MRYPIAPTAELASAIRRFESGLFEQAGIQLLAILQKNPSDEDAQYFLTLVKRRLAREALPPATLIWQFDPKGSWERDWLHELLAGCFQDEIIDNTWSKTAPVMIVVDNRLVPEKAFYYRDAFATGRRVILVHLSDEAFKDDTGIYKYCDGVVRNYYSEVLVDDARVHFIPLGCKAGFCGHAASAKPAAARKHLWSFAGDAKKLTRAPMLAAMERAGAGFTHLTEGFGTADALSTADYRALLDETVIVPCPGGWSNLETFRTYEALEAGCIPIVEKRPGFDYYTALLGPHPIPGFLSWDEAAAFIRGLSAVELEKLRTTCSAWWQTRKPQLAKNVNGFLDRALRGPYAAETASSSTASVSS